MSEHTPLEPCPFCGSKDLQHSIFQNLFNNIVCQACGAKTTTQNWNNRRPTPQQPSEPLKELECKHEWVEQNLSDWCKLCGKIRPYAINTNPFNKPSEKKALDIEEIIRLFQIFQLTDERNRPQTGIPDWNYNDLALAIYDAIPIEKKAFSRKEVYDLGYADGKAAQR